jgi:transposase
LEKIPLASWASRLRQDLLDLLDRMNPTIAELTAAVEQEAKKRPEVLRLMIHPGVGSLTALAFVIIIMTPERFPCGKQIGSYLGLIPCEDSSAGRQLLPPRRYACTGSPNTRGSICRWKYGEPGISFTPICCACLLSQR